MNRTELQAKLTDTLVELFEIPRDKITPDAKLFEELGLDSIDAIDLIVQLQVLTERRIAPDEFRAVRTVGDVLDCVEKILAQPSTATPVRHEPAKG